MLWGFFFFLPSGCSPCCLYLGFSAFNRENFICKNTKTPTGQPILCYVIAHRVKIKCKDIFSYLSVQVLVLPCVDLFFFFSSLLECTKVYEKDPCVEWMTIRENPEALEGTNPNLGLSVSLTFKTWRTWAAKAKTGIPLPWCLIKKIKNSGTPQT